MKTLIEGLWIATALYLFLCLVLSYKALALLPPVDRTRKRWPRISVLIPARNEEKRIDPLLRSLMKMDYPNYEVLVLDDESTDKTAQLVRTYSRRYSRVKLLKGKPLPKGWRGKPWACHQLSKSAKGEWIIFVDADTWFEPDVLKRSLQAAEQKGADVLSLFPHEEMGTWVEKLVLPTLFYCLLSFAPMGPALKKGSFLNKVVGAGGQFCLFKKSSYRTFGGHEAIRNEIVDDIQIGRVAARAGFYTTFFDGTDTAHCRMYTNAREVWDGFSKNMYPFLKFNTLLAITAMAGLFFMGVAPWIILLKGTSSVLFVSAMIIAIAQWVVRLFQAFRYRMPVLSAILHPIGCFLFILIGINSIIWYEVKKEGIWRGRALKPN